MKPDQVRAQAMAMSRAGMTPSQIAEKLVVVKQMSERHIRNLLTPIKDKAVKHG